MIDEENVRDARTIEELRTRIEALETLTPWRPLTRYKVDNSGLEKLEISSDELIDEVWRNDEYEVQVRYLNPDRAKAGALHLSIKRLDKQPANDWRDLQSIKNEVCGWEREGFELFPAESRLVDQSDQTHLWVIGAAGNVPVGWQERALMTPEQRVENLTELGLDPAKGSQRPWREGISTGPDYKP